MEYSAELSASQRSEWPKRWIEPLADERTLEALEEERKALGLEPFEGSQELGWVVHRVVENFENFEDFIDSIPEFQHTLTFDETQGILRRLNAGIVRRARRARRTGTARSMVARAKYTSRVDMKVAVVRRSAMRALWRTSAPPPPAMVLSSENASAVLGTLNTEVM